MGRKTNAGVICQAYDGSGLGENTAVVAEGGPEVMYRSFDLKRTRTSLIKELTISSSFIYIDKTSESPVCGMCGEKGEILSHLVTSECSKLAQGDLQGAT